MRCYRSQHIKDAGLCQLKLYSQYLGKRLRLKEKSLLGLLLYTLGWIPISEELHKTYRVVIYYTQKILFIRPNLTILHKNLSCLHLVFFTLIRKLDLCELRNRVYVRRDIRYSICLLAVGTYPILQSLWPHPAPHPHTLPCIRILAACPDQMWLQFTGHVLQLNPCL